MNSSYYCAAMSTGSGGEIGGIFKIHSEREREREKICIFANFSSIRAFFDFMENQTTNESTGLKCGKLSIPSNGSNAFILHSTRGLREEQTMEQKDIDRWTEIEIERELCLYSQLNSSQSFSLAADQIQST